MNWITDYVKPRIKAVLAPKPTEAEMWARCDGCGQMVFQKDLADNQHVCPGCAHHFKIRPKERFGHLFDEGRFVEIAYEEPAKDPLKFRDQRRYTDRMKEARSKTSLLDCAVTAKGEIGGHEAVMIAHDFTFMAGSMGMALGNAFLAAAERALTDHCPFVAFPAAGGARMQEGILSLMQMPRTTVAIQRLQDAGLPVIMVLTDPTTGGVTASYAMLGDIHLAEPKALICFAGPRVIEQTIREKLPDGFQRSEYLLEHGMIDRVVDRREMRGELINLLNLLCGPKQAQLTGDTDLEQEDQQPTS
ncbi:MAG TPA: acetyl-CoA carboxylase carboxyl transferase subunit beta [Alphaproteobacteria bacterium]|nr:MAG: acetyl-CoA carboxylase carboxyltransferase subunit beta [SAR116 cluster bacterium]HBQ22328.1 acetyl-CoA carboxylase carboxyl transferase subunit beta [Alphaproteobacteria bacterium]HCJ62376.1 acetyl-CoA carboxylase carboxyl transferase subunit beta [Alphaproteobacteria bacterium]HCY47802.1 acetyl-CoA carboxylase carboxyl transferase subunit beta [Alphaproteobacteria bacterium]|tara:strand:+ start:8206 stop:9114 length:909 start_codon:yes stop_codon:yes gene_type:complete